MFLMIVLCTLIYQLLTQSFIYQYQHLTIIQSVPYIPIHRLSHHFFFQNPSHSFICHYPIQIIFLPLHYHPHLTQMLFMFLPILVLHSQFFYLLPTPL